MTQLNNGLWKRLSVGYDRDSMLSTFARHSKLLKKLKYRCSKPVIGWNFFRTIGYSLAC